MKYLLDVNALVAWGQRRSPHHLVFHKWLANIGLKNVAVCSLSELGYVRVSMNAFGNSITDAKKGMELIRKQTGGYVTDFPPPVFPAWTTTAAQTTDAYLCQLATVHKMKLATFDAGIKDPAAVLIS